MVYRGTPSRDCLPCRRRKLRCDLQKESCGQCRRANLTCTGYRDPHQLVIRDETQAIRQKALAQASHQECLSAANTSIATLQLSWDVRARHVFFCFYVFGLSRSYDMLSSLYEREPPDGHLSMSVDAVSLAFLSHQHDAPDLSALAGKRYLAAIQLLGQALGTPAQATSDATLQAVLLLDLYEKIVNRNPKSSSSWMSHVNGAMSLVAIRGKHRTIASHVARRLAMRLVITLIISCGAAGIRVPAALSALREDLSRYVDEKDPKWAVTGEVVGLLNLNADVRDGKITDGAEILARLRQLDERFITLERELPPSWHGRRVLVADSEPLVFEGHYDMHRDHFVTQVRNVIHTTRLAINVAILAHAGDNVALKGEASAVIDGIAREICSSAPQFVLPAARPQNKVPLTPLQALQCYTLISPVYHAGQVSSDPRMRPWVVSFLEHIAEVGGVRVAREVADVMRYRPETSHWHVYAMLGSYAFAA